MQLATLESIKECRKILRKHKTRKKLNSIKYRQIFGIDGVRK